MSKHGKRYFNALKKAPKKEVTLEEAVKFVKDNAGAKFDETVDVYFHLGKELTKGDTAVRGTVKLPNGSGKTVKVAVFAGGDHAEEARQAGADYVGLADLIDKVTKEGWCDFDVAIATVEAMKEVRKCARILGPRGLMPNPKTGTVTDDTATAVKEAKGGKVDFRMDKTGNMAVVAGKRSFDADKLVQNIKAIVAAVQAAKPATVKGVFIKSMSVSSTMGIGVPVQVVGDAE
ncbi:MAG: 50S ribosomal protein L1 [Kiritimatiellae bacterium]|jgi:large subunit ribosomal protein L1|nr:50S ribosomal protein L1 [Kiritimatiellia bacterium]MBR3957462.1 50S ribosomal protein L1 [Kiritimatiellia bacterium]MCR5839513.1 50S ribosomal protein L1 [Kiritimatiellia bacterium]